jgi:CxxC motif-containing protein (DUF1111 family)
MRSPVHALALALLLTSACVTSLDDTGDDTGEGSLNAVLALGVNPAGTTAVFFVENAQWADLHYRVNGGQQLNVRMAVTNNRNTYTVGNLVAGDTIDYNFTYFDLACPCARDSAAARYVHGGGGPTPGIDAGVPPAPDAGPVTPPLPGVNPYPVPAPPTGGTTGGTDRSGSVAPLFPAGTALEAPTVVDTGSALVTKVGDRVRDRHARESQFRIYDHFLPLYFINRTYSIEIIDNVAKGGNSITVNLYTMTAQDNPNFRAFFMGRNTVAEYFHNADFARVNDLHYTSTVTFNAKEGRAIRNGDRMEMEVGIFLRQPVEGRFNYYSSAWLYIVGQGGIAPFQGQGALLDSFPLPDNALLGGRTTLNYPYSDEPDKRFMQMPTNIAPGSAQPWVEGRRLLHTDFRDGTHSEGGNPVFSEHAGKVGPRFVAASCQSCHVRNGRSLPPAVNATIANASMRVGEVSGSNASPHAQLGTVVQPFATSGAIEGTAVISSWVTESGTFADGTSYQLRRPRFSGTGPIPNAYSLRATPPLIGLGLLEAVAESTIRAFVDVNDSNGDGISGRMQVVTDSAGQTRMGRFGWKAGQASLAQQVASALNRDMGVKSSLFPTLDCGGAQTGCSNGAAALGDAALDRLVRYVALLGVPARRDLGSSAAQAGEALFTSAGCASCHKPTLTTGSTHPKTELRNQTIRPYTDLLLHDMGPGLADNLPEGIASGAEWRTPPLWGIGLTAGVSGGEAYLHDGRARNLTEAILWHGGEGQNAKNAFVNMSASQRANLLTFLGTL